MSIAKLKTVYSNGAFINNVKAFFNKINEIIDYLNNNPSYTPSYKVYTALLTQTGTDAPVATVLENTIGDIVWTYVNPGYYQGVLTNAFPSNKTFVMAPSSVYTSNLPSGGDMDIYSAGVDSINEVFYTTSLLNGSTGVLSRQNSVNGGYPKIIEIRVYN
jgi:hypothetical protein